jgi:hypothetical protein
MPSKAKYTCPYTIVYVSPRYGKTITVPFGYESDGATGALDIWSEGWWVHDVLCDRGTWDDGTPATNWQASQILQDILHDEGRKWRAHGWFWATFLFGGGKARENGLWKLSPHGDGAPSLPSSSPTPSPCPTDTGD